MKGSKRKVRVEIHIADKLTGDKAKTYCGLSVYGPYKVFTPDKNIKSIASAVRARGGTAHICIFCTKFGALAELRDMDL